MARERVQGTVIDGHSHIGAMDAWKFYDLKEPVKPAVYEFATTGDYLKHVDDLGVERALVLPNYGIPVQSQPFSLNPLVLDTVKSNDRIRGGLWVSFLPQNKEMTLEALRHAGEEGIVALKTTFLLGGNPGPGRGTRRPGRSSRRALPRPASMTWCSTSTPVHGSWRRGVPAKLGRQVVLPVRRPAP